MQVMFWEHVCFILNIKEELSFIQEILIVQLIGNIHVKTLIFQIFLKILFNFHNFKAFRCCLD